VSVFVASLVVSDTSAFTDRTISVSSTEQLSSLGGSTHDVAAAVRAAALVGYLPFFVAAAVRQLIRYRRSTGTDRQQLKWLMSGGAVAVIGLLVAATASNSSPLSALFVAIVALPLSMGVAILKYRLYEIDKLISRTISYLLVTGLLVGVFAAIVLLTTRVLPFSSPIGVAASTLTAAALFNPLRRRVQHLIDRRFNRARYDAEAILAGFSGRLRQTVDLMTIQQDLLEAVNLSLTPGHASLWIKPPT
jgi:hypothetical protein